MELTSLKYFVTVAEELHFGRAARRLNVSQPPLSRQVMKLEDELGVKLFHRSSRVVELTEAGNIFLEEARAVLRRAELMTDRMGRLCNGQSGILSIGFNEPVLNTILPKTVKAFRERYRDVELRLFEMDTAEQLAALRNGEIDLALLRPLGGDLAGFSVRLLYREKYLLVLPQNHPLLKFATVPLPELKNHELIMFARRSNPAVHMNILESLHNAGIEPLIRQEAGNKATILALVQAGLGVGIVPESTRATAPPGAEFRPLGPGLPPVEIMAAWQENNSSPILENFLKLLKN